MEAGGCRPKVEEESSVEEPRIDTDGTPNVFDTGEKPKFETKAKSQLY